MKDVFMFHRKLQLLYLGRALTTM